MKIVVCVNHVPDTATRINISSDQKTLDSNGVTYILNPYDEYAIEEALKTKESIGGEIVAISLGKEANKETLRKVLALGVDNAVLLKTDEILDSLSVAKSLANEIKAQEADLVFMGKQSVDFDNSIMGQLVAALLKFNIVSTAISFNLDGNKITAEREIEGGKETIETTIPAVITAQKGLNEPRYASLKGIMAAKKKNIEEKEITSTNNFVNVLEMKKPIAKPAGKIVGVDSSAVPELVRLLKEEAKVI
ncbi:MAG: electron transfer flavoprotein subunit beta/FixA family protein [Bacteroidetes bacterium]|nr:electron transfer flavoprotein subunit beta/FixA family protein [Bacteroidota bacterium]MBU1116286.1 electron transfer flavoprotein subunit beta/FixA family protein [Bacteroidota bacterium]MBU1797134.1 electron transfer flavoprotein subunit beta/FixA family protein [Bacteroidota bacterium]